MTRDSDPVQKPTVFILCFVLTMFGGSVTFCFAQISPIEIPSSLNPIGSGARALGMGGAFIAVADDATAASWNPGGLIQLERPEVSLVGGAFHRIEDNTFGTNPEGSGKQGVSEWRINYLSAVYPFSLLGYNMIASVNYQNLYDFTREWDFFLSQSANGFSVNQNVDYEQEGSLSALGIAYCIQITRRFSLGATLNFWEDGLYRNSWEQETIQRGSGIDAGDGFTFETRSFDEYTFSGLSANLGILWDVTNKLTLGAVFKTPFTADLEHESRFDSSIVFPGNPARNSTTSIPSDEDEELDMPMSYGIGFSYRFSDKFTASLDIYRTEWDDYVRTDSNGNETSPITGQPTSESDIDPTHQVRVGAEYLFIEPRYVIPLRTGIFYDPAPAQGSPDDFYGFSVGSGIAYGRFVFDIAYQYRFGNNVGASLLQNLDFSHDVDEHTVFASLIIHF